MKLCQKCDDAVKYLLAQSLGQAVSGKPFGAPVSESDCEFWAHKELNQTSEVLAEKTER